MLIKIIYFENYMIILRELCIFLKLLLFVFFLVCYNLNFTFFCYRIIVATLQNSAVARRVGEWRINVFTEITDVW